MATRTAASLADRRPRRAPALASVYALCYRCDMDLMRFNVIDARGTVSFVAPCHTLKVLTAACAQNPATLEELLAYADPYDPQLGAYVLDGLAVFDEHNTAQNSDAIRSALLNVPSDKTPPFRVTDAVTREASLTPVRTGLVIYNLLAKRIIQVQNSYANVERQDRGRVRENGLPTNKLYRYKLPDDWRLLP